MSNFHVIQPKDLITLLFIYFIYFYLISTTGTTQQIQLLAYIISQELYFTLGQRFGHNLTEKLFFLSKSRQ